MCAGQIAVAFLKAQQEAAFLALFLKHGDLLTDILKSGQDVHHLDAVALCNHISQWCGYNGFNCNRFLWHGSMCNTLFCNIVKHQHTDLISSWKHILSMMIYRNTNAVCVWVGCQNQVTVYLLAQLNTKLQGCFFFRVWVWTGWEFAIWTLLFPYNCDIFNAHLAQNTANQFISSTVKRSVYYLEAALSYRSFVDSQGEYLVQILVYQFIGYVLDHTGAQTFIQRHLLDTIKNITFCCIFQHLCSSFRIQLAAFLVVSLVTIVLRWIVAGSNHDTSTAFELTNCKRKGWSWHQFFKQICLYAICCKDTCGHPCKQITFNTAVISNRNGWVFILFVDIVSHTLSCQCDCINIHPVSSHTQNTAQTCCSKFQHTDKAFFDFLFVSLDLNHFCDQVRIFQLFFFPNFISFQIVHRNPPFLILMGVLRISLFSKTIQN